MITEPLSGSMGTWLFQDPGKYPQMPYPKMPQTARFLSGRFCQISIRILDPAFNKVNFYLDPDPAYKNRYFGAKRVNFGSGPS
jgi:hypothetical protein